MLATVQKLEGIIASLHLELDYVHTFCEANELLQKQSSLLRTQLDLKQSIQSYRGEIKQVIHAETDAHFENVTITLIRHAESAFNVLEESKCSDRQNVSLLDCALTPQGIEQCNALSLQFDLLLVSPLQRCQQTLQHSNIGYANCVVLHILREYKTDICDFRENEAIIYETEPDIIGRIEATKDVLEWIIANNTELCSIGLVGHHDFFWYLTSEIIGDERFGTGLDNAGFVALNAKALLS